MAPSWSTHCAQTEPVECSPPQVVLEGGGLTLTLDVGDPTWEWTPYRHRLDTTAPWVVEGTNRFAHAAEIRRVLTCVTAFLIRGEFTNGPDRGWLAGVSFGLP